MRLINTPLFVREGQDSRCHYCKKNRTTKEIYGGGRKGITCCDSCWPVQRAARDAEVVALTVALADARDMTDGEWLAGGWRN